MSGVWASCLSAAPYEARVNYLELSCHSVSDCEQQQCEGPGTECLQSFIHTILRWKALASYQVR